MVSRHARGHTEQERESGYPEPFRIPKGTQFIRIDPVKESPPLLGEACIIYARVTNI
ncbi:MAG: hypothetical protein QMC96_00280 [Methanomicrobiales archaeon]|nr:hypothetical protein [Methanomicrobiales archaeon]